MLVKEAPDGNSTNTPGNILRCDISRLAPINCSPGKMEGIVYFFFFSNPLLLRKITSHLKYCHMFMLARKQWSI